MPGNSSEGHFWEYTVVNVSDASHLLKLCGTHGRSCLCHPSGMASGIWQLFLRDLRGISRKVATIWIHQGDATAGMSHSTVHMLTLRMLRLQGPTSITRRRQMQAAMPPLLSSPTRHQTERAPRLFMALLVPPPAPARHSPRGKRSAGSASESSKKRSR